MSSEARDARRWATFERLVADPAAAPSERAQAAEQLELLRARYPGGPPAQARPVPPGRRSAGHRTYGHSPWGEAEAPRARETDPAEQAARAAEARRQREQAVAAQRAAVERVPDWQRSGMLRDLHASDAVWGEEERRWFKEQRVRLTGSSRASDL